VEVKEHLKENHERPDNNRKSSQAELASTSDDVALIQRLQSLTSATLAISSELDLETVLQRISDTAREFANAHYAALGIVNEEGVIQRFITSGISKEQREKIGEPPRGHGLLGVLIKQGKPVRVPDISKDPRRSGFPPNHPPMTSLLGVPVEIHGSIVGDLYLADKIGHHEFTAEDEWWVTLFARQAAVAVQNAHLYKNVEISRQRSQTLAELAGKLNESIVPEKLFQQITEAACSLLEVPASALYLLDSGRTRFEMQAHVGLQDTADGQFFLPVERTVAGRVLSEDSSIAISDSSKEQEICLPRLKSGIEPKALLVVPIRQAGQVSGVLSVYATYDREFSREEITLLEAFAGQAALALEKAQLYKHKEEFLSMTAHDLRAPLSAIKMSVGLLEAHLPTDLPPVLTRLVSNISRNSERLSNLLNDLLDLTRLEQGRIRLNLERLEVGEAVAATAHTLVPLFEEKAQKLELDKPRREYWVMIDRRRFEQALVNLLTNANKYTPREGVVRVVLNVSDDAVTISICDSGPGIPPEEQIHIFDRYYRRPVHEQTAETTGSGLGLPIARYLIELHEGELWVESEVGQGSTFFIKLPLHH
jgi:signal transduction histidine kinase